eukprot:6180156-Pleurochrysis_carterae.AAC.3
MTIYPSSFNIACARRLAEGVHRHVERPSGRAGSAPFLLLIALFHFGIGADIASYDLYFTYSLAHSCEALSRRIWRRPRRARSKNPGSNIKTFLAPYAGLICQIKPCLQFSHPCTLRSECQRLAQAL